MTTAAIDIALPLFTGHLLGDFVLQTNRMVREKSRWAMLLLHAVIVTGVTYLLIGHWREWSLPLAVFLSHWLIDWLKVRWGKGGVVAFVIDQIAHLVVLTLLTVAWGCGETQLSFWAQQWGPRWWSLLAALSGLVLVVRVGGMLVGYWVQPYLDEIQKAVRSGNEHFRPTRGLTNGGRVIGQWERALIFLFVGLSQPAAVGFLVAAKSIFRFGELKDRENRMEAEYITIGTLMSFGWALAVSYPTWWLTRWLWG
jgi:hypothetical protein